MSVKENYVELHIKLQSLWQYVERALAINCSTNGHQQAINQIKGFNKFSTVADPDFPGGGGNFRSGCREVY